MVFLRSDAAGRCFRRVRLYAFGTVVAAFVVAAAEAYRFYPNADDLMVSLAADALR